MLSTGEVACLANYQEAYLKALKSSGFKIKNKCNVLISIGSHNDKDELFESKKLTNNGFSFLQQGTTNYYTKGIII